MKGRSFMKKFLCILLAAMLLLTCFTGCKKNPDNLSSVSSVIDVDNTQTQEEFKKPENYASVVTVTINPQFRLYLDASGIVLAVEPVNADAKSIETKITFENQKVETVVGNLIVAANDGGFVKEDAKIDIKITEVVDEAVVADDILDDIKISADDKLSDLNIKAEVTVTVEIKTEEPTQTPEKDTTSKEDTSSEDKTSSKPTPQTDKHETPKTEAPVCKHTKTSVISLSTGKNIIDGSKLDVINHAKVCDDCDKQIALEKHTVKDNKCTVCGQSNFAITNINVDTAGISGGPSGHDGAEISGDGTPDFDFMMQEGYFALGFDSLQKYLNEDTWFYEIPESVFYAALKTKFVVDDNIFAKLKAQGEYEFFWTKHSYSNGVFYIAYTACGDVPEYTHNLIGYTDNKNGTITVYYDYFEGGPDVEESERKHQYYYAVEYTYSGASNLAIIKKTENDYEYYVIEGWTPVVNSMRIKSIKKVTDISGITAVK